MSVLEDPWALAAARVQSEVESDVVADATEILAAEHARTPLSARLHPGSAVRVTLTSGACVSGLVIDVAPQFVDVLDGDGDAHLINLAQVDAIDGLPGALRPEHEAKTLTRWTTLVRSLEDESVQIELRSGQWVRGYVAVVGADHLDVCADERRVTVPIDGLIRLRRRHRTDAY